MSLFVYSSYYLKLSWIFILFWRPKKSLIKSSHPKNTCQIFLPKNISELKFQTPKILLSSSTLENLEYPLKGFIYVWYCICMGFCWIQSLQDCLTKQEKFKTWYDELIYMNGMKMDSWHNGIRFGPFLVLSGSLSSQTQVQCKKAELGCMHAW